MKLTLKYNLPFTLASLTYEGRTVELKSVLVDTGSASTVVSADIVESIGIRPQPGDILNKLRGIGGTEVVYTRVIDRILVGGASVTDFELEIGGMDYGFEIHGIVGMDFLRRTGAVVDLGAMTLEF